MIIDIDKIYRKYYNDNQQLLATVLIHSEAVARKALSCLREKNLPVDADFIYSAAMLHDIGVVKCNAPSIYCYGKAPYICHGIIGKSMLESEGLPRHALICERHTGAGLSREDIEKQKLPLPHKDMCPLTIEEKLICYADKFFSKSGKLEKEKDIEKIINQMAAHGEKNVERFMEYHLMFGSH